MNKGDEGLIFLCSGFMAIIWRYAWANYLTIAAFNRPFPLAEAVMTFGMGSLLVYLSFGRGWRVIWILCLQLLGFTLTFSRMIYVFHGQALPFFNPHWLVEFMGRSKGLLEYFSVFFLLAWTLIFYFGGWFLVSKPRTYVNICARFDIGISSLLGLFLLKYVIWFKGGGEIPDPFSGAVIFPFFLFSLLAISLTRNRSEAKREYLPGSRGIGIIMGFILVVLLLGTGFISFLLPYMTLIAKAGYGAMKIVATPIGSVLVGILRFLFSAHKVRPEPRGSFAGKDSDLSAPAIDSGWWSGPIGEIVRIFFFILLGLLVLMFIILLLWLLIKWLLPKFRALFERTPHSRHDKWNLFPLLAKMWNAFSRLVHTVGMFLVGKRMSTVQLYAALLKWGRRSGVPPYGSETPLEFGSRLKIRFPVVKKDVESIIDLYNREVYGGISADVQEQAGGIRAWCRLRSPAHWGIRLKTWLFNPTYPLR